MKTKNWIGLGGVVAIAGYLYYRNRNNQEDLETVEYVDLQRYAGLWYEIIRLPVRFEKKCTDTTAHYSMNEDGSIKVVNSCRKNGNPETVTGKAYLADSKTQAKLKVEFQWPFRGDYWILDLDDNYEYVGTPSRKSLWILCRHLEPDQDKLLSLIIKARLQGFDIDKLIFTDHHQQESELQTQTT